MHILKDNSWFEYNKIVVTRTNNYLLMIHVLFVFAKNTPLCKRVWLWIL